MKKIAEKECTELHEKAMNLAHLAHLAEKKEDSVNANKNYTNAFKLEKQAAMFLVNDFSIEPSRSVLFRSAASLAIKAKLYREAERMAAFGLSGNPPEIIANELRDVFHQSLQYLKLVA